MVKKHMNLPLFNSDGVFSMLPHYALLSGHTLLSLVWLWVNRSQWIILWISHQKQILTSALDADVGVPFFSQTVLQRLTFCKEPTCCPQGSNTEENFPIFVVKCRRSGGLHCSWATTLGESRDQISEYICRDRILLSMVVWRTINVFNI